VTLIDLTKDPANVNIPKASTVLYTLSVAQRKDRIDRRGAAHGRAFSAVKQMAEGRTSTGRRTQRQP